MDKLGGYKASHREGVTGAVPTPTSVDATASLLLITQTLSLDSRNLKCSNRSAGRLPIRDEIEISTHPRSVTRANIG